MKMFSLKRNDANLCDEDVGLVGYHTKGHYWGQGFNGILSPWRPLHVQAQSPVAQYCQLVSWKHQ